MPAKKSKKEAAAPKKADTFILFRLRAPEAPKMIDALVAKDRVNKQISEHYKQGNLQHGDIVAVAPGDYKHAELPAGVIPLSAFIIS